MLPFILRAWIVSLGFLGVVEGIKRMTNKKVFVSFAIEDRNIRDLLVGQAKHDKTPFEFIDMSVKEPWESSWKTNCRQRIKGCDGVIALISKNTAKADGAIWEIQCALDENIPLLLMYVSSNDKNYSIPTILKNKRIVDWSWPNIKKFMDGL